MSAMRGKSKLITGVGSGNLETPEKLLKAKRICTVRKLKKDTYILYIDKKEPGYLSQSGV
jgi:hypothetical protein